MPIFLSTSHSLFLLQALDGNVSARRLFSYVFDQLPGNRQRFQAFFQAFIYMSKRIRPETQAQRIILLAFLSYLLNAWNRLKGLVGRSHLQGKSFQSGSIYKRSPLVRIRKGLTLVGRLDRWIPFLSFVPRGYAAALWSRNGG